MRVDRNDRITKILEIDDCELFCVELYNYLVMKKGSLTRLEGEAFLLLSMHPDIEMEGFADLFYGLYSLSECTVVENGLRKLGLDKLADLFNEAKSIYQRGMVDISQEEFDQLDPFTLDQTQGERFDAIGEIFLSKESDIHLLPSRLCQFFKSHASEQN